MSNVSPALSDECLTAGAQFPWTEVFGHATQLAALQNGWRQGRLAHTQLFVGRPGIGKRRFALALAQCLMCERGSSRELRACGTCPGCKQARKGTHPDLMLIGCPEGKSELPIELFVGPRESRGQDGLCHQLSLRPMAAERKVAVIDDAERLSLESANALLKTLEEPPAHSLIVLIAPSTDDLLATIRSRSQVLRFAPLSPEQVRQVLLKEGLCDNPEAADEAAALSEGSVSCALQLLDAELRERRKSLHGLLSRAPLDNVMIVKSVLEWVQEAGTETAAQRRWANWLLQFVIEFLRAALLSLTRADSASVAPQVATFVSRMSQGGMEAIERVGDALQCTFDALDQIQSFASLPVVLECWGEKLGRVLGSQGPSGR